MNGYNRDSRLGRLWHVPAGIHPGGGVVGYVGIRVVPLRAWRVGLDAVGGEEAAEPGVEVARAQEGEAGLRVELLAREAEDAGRAGAGPQGTGMPESQLPSRRGIWRPHHGQ